MRPTEIEDYIKAFQETFEIFRHERVNLAKVTRLTQEVFKKGRYSEPPHDLTTEEYLAVTTAVALLAPADCKLHLSGESYEILVYLSLKAGQDAQARAFVNLALERFPIELLDGVLRGLAVYDVETNSDTGKKILLDELKGRALYDVQKNAQALSLLHKTQWVWNVIRKHLFSTIAGIVAGIIVGIVGRIIFSTFLKQ